MPYLIVFIGAGIGGALRHGVNSGAARWLGGFPVATMIVNIFGSFLMGLAAGWFLARPGLSQPLRLFLTTGILGGFTTFSAFSLDAVALMHKHAYALAVGYVVGSVGAGLLALLLGLHFFGAKDIQA